MPRFSADETFAAGTSVVKRGRMLFEMGGVDEVTAREAMRLAAYKLPLQSKFILKAAEAAVPAEETV